MIKGMDKKSGGGINQMIANVFRLVMHGYASIFKSRARIFIGFYRPDERLHPFSVNHGTENQAR
jgi:hypothetical protein